MTRLFGCGICIETTGKSEPFTCAHCVEQHVKDIHFRKLPYRDVMENK